MTGIALNPRVQQLNLQQPEFIKPVWDYLDSAVSARPASPAASRCWRKKPCSLAGIEQRFGVQKEILVAFWGDESNYGASMGGFNMFEALSTLAYDGPRADFGSPRTHRRAEDGRAALTIPGQTTSSWAGRVWPDAVHCRPLFCNTASTATATPSVDQWHSPADALASSINLLVGAAGRKGGDAGV